MDKRTLVVLSLFFLCLVSTNFISSASPFDVIQEECGGITIEYPKFYYLIGGEDYNLRFHVFNSSTGKLLTNETTECVFNLYNQTGNNIARLIPSFNNLGVGECQNCFNLKIGGENLTAGSYSYLIRCNASDIGGAVSVGFEVVRDGKEPTIQKLTTEITFLLFSILLFFGFYFLKGHVDLEKLNNSIRKKYENKNYVKLVFSSISYNVLKNSFIIYYLLGLFVLFNINYLLLTYNLTSLISIFEPIIIIYTIGIILVGILFLSYVQEWLKDLIDEVSNLNWGIGGK